MNYAIAITKGKLAPCFSKAQIFEFYNTQHRKVAVYKNPILNVSGCAAKKLLIDLLIERQCNTLIVRKVGEKTLAKLLHAGIKVQQGNTRHHIEVLLENARLETHLLMDEKQGVPKKTKCACHH